MSSSNLSRLWYGCTKARVQTVRTHVVHIEETLGVKVEGDKLQELKTLQDVYVLATESVLKAKSKAAHN
jgi:hypothetical protein